jgi:Fe-S-cluster-containing hydrogenase component 2
MINPDKCNGCRRCEVVCSFVNHDECNPSLSRIKIVKVEKNGINLPMVCQHCETPVCMDVCPVNALIREEKTHAIILTSDLCIGCRACMIICPYGAISIDPETRSILKCNLCGGDPECVKVCEPKALDFVDADKADMFRKRSAMELFSSHILKIRKEANID